MEQLLYDKILEETIDLFNENENKNEMPDFLEYDSPLLKKGKQGIIGFLRNKENNQKYIYKISQYLDFVINQEYNVMKDLNTLRDYCPHFVKMFSKFKLPLSSNYRRAKNPFLLNKEYKTITSEVLVMQYVNAKKFVKYIKNDDIPTLHLLSIIKQSLLATIIANQKVNFTHYDLHSDNILIKHCDPNIVFLYIINNVYYMVPTFGIYPIIIDFGFSYSKSSDKDQMYCSLSHTDYGFLQCKEDCYGDAKLFLPSVSHEINRYRESETSQNFRNLVKNIYKDAKVQLDCGWDKRQKTSINDDFLEDYEKTFEKSPFFKEQSIYILDLLQTLIVLPLKYRRSKESTKELLSLVINEFSKIEKLISDDFYHLYIFKEMIISVNKNRELYTSNSTRLDAVNYFKNDILKAIDKVAKYGNIKLNWEKLLCSLLCLSKNIENYCYEKMEKLCHDKNKDYKKIPLSSTIEIYKSIEANFPSEFKFNKQTILYIWNADTENSTKIRLEPKLIELLNKTHPFDRGDVYKDFLNNEFIDSESSDRSKRSDHNKHSDRSDRSKCSESSKSSKHSESSKHSKRSKSSEPEF